MNIALFLLIFAVCEVLTPLFTQAIKSMLDSLKVSYAANIVVLGTSLVVSVTAMVFTYVFMSIPLTVLNVFYIVFMFAANWLGSMIGYDKVKQAIAQIRSDKDGQ